jgi:hypothetical protein
LPPLVFAAGARLRKVGVEPAGAGRSHPFVAPSRP